MAFTQTNARLIAGYSSVAQLGFITLGIFALAPQGAQGAVLQMVNHGLVVAPLFFIIGAARRARRGLGGHPRHGRDRDARAGPRDDLPDRRLRDARDARIGQLRRRVPDPARPVPDEDGLLDHRLRRRRDGERLHAAHVHPHDAQPRRSEGRTRASCACATRSCWCRSSARSCCSRSTRSCSCTAARASVDASSQRQLDSATASSDRQRPAPIDARGAHHDRTLRRGRAPARAPRQLRRRSRRSRRCSAARCSCCWSACCARAFAREQVVPRADARRARR